MQRAMIMTAVVLFLTGCQSGYEKYYVDQRVAVHELIEDAAGNTNPVIYSSSGDPDLDERRMFEDGYARIGYSSFHGALESEKKAIEQAIKVGADAIVIFREFTNSVTSSIPITTRTPVTTYSTGSASAYGYGGSAYGTYSGTSTTYVPKTTYVPITIDKYDQSAIFFAKMKPSCLGYLAEEVPSEERQAIGTNSGFRIAAVRRNGTFFKADIVPGDIVLEVNGNRSDGRAPVHAYRSGQEMKLKIFRSGNILEKTVITGTCS